jgi:hypothetical protein
VPNNLPSTLNNPAAVAARDAASRAQRLSQQILKCGDLLKDIAKQPSSVWFLEPVDPVKLGIPDYFTIIKEPMDFRTIRTNLEKGVYENTESFAEHMRLVFKNALTYNSSKDNPVHISARELSYKFEEKYRIMTSQLSSSGMISSAKIEAIAGASKKSSNPKPKSAGGPGQMPSRAKSLPGPRAMESILPPVLDTGGMHQLIEMQRKMQEMQDEIMKLRTAVRQNEIKSAIDSQRFLFSSVFI